MQTAVTEPIDELPEDVAAAWATVLLDLWEKCPSPAAHDSRQASEPANAAAGEDESDGD